jgi:hypothetical protein
MGRRRTIQWRERHRAMTSGQPLIRSNTVTVRCRSRRAGRRTHAPAHGSLLDVVPEWFADWCRRETIGDGAAAMLPIPPMWTLGIDEESVEALWLGPRLVAQPVATFTDPWSPGSMAPGLPVTPSSARRRSCRSATSPAARATRFTRSSPDTTSWSAHPGPGRATRPSCPGRRLIDPGSRKRLVSARRRRRHLMTPGHELRHQPLAQNPGPARREHAHDHHLPDSRVCLQDLGQTAPGSVTRAAMWSLRHADRAVTR